MYPPRRFKINDVADAMPVEIDVRYVSQCRHLSFCLMYEGRGAVRTYPFERSTIAAWSHYAHCPCICNLVNWCP